MKRFLILCMTLVMFCGCNSEHARSTNDNENMRRWAENAKKAENETFKQTIKDETAHHKAEQAKYNDVIKHPEKYADVVDLNTGQNVPSGTFSEPPPSTLPSITDPNTPEVFKIPAKGVKSISNPQCKTCKENK